MTVTSGLHKDANGINVHVPYTFSYSNQTDRLTGTGTSASDVGKFARQTDNNTIWMLTDDSPVTWVAVSSTGSASGGSIGNLSNFTYVRKATTESVNNTTTFQNDNELLFAVGANEIWDIEYILSFNGPSGGDIKFAFMFPVSGTVDTFTFGPATNFSDDAGEGNVRSQVLAQPTGTIAAAFGCNFGITTNNPLSGMLKALYRGGMYSGNVTLQWAQLSTVASNTYVYAGSYLIARKVG